MPKRPTSVREPTKRSRKTQQPGKSQWSDKSMTDSGVTAKAINALEAIVASQRPMTIPEIVSTSGMTTPTAHRITKMLLDMGLIERDADRRHREGKRLLELAFAAIEASCLRDPRRQILRALAEVTGENCLLCIQDGSETVSIAYAEGRHTLGIRLVPGMRFPLHCNAAGKLLLSLLPVVQRDRIMSGLNLKSLASKTITDAAKLQEEIEIIQHRKYATAESEALEGVCGLAVPVVSPSGKNIGALLVTSPIARCSCAQLQQFLPALREAATNLGATF